MDFIRKQYFDGHFAPQTMVELLRWRAEHQTGQRLYTYLLDGDQEEMHLTFGELDRQARRIAAHLQEAGKPGERALLLYPPGLEYISAYFGCLYAGIIAVPAYPPRLNRPSPRIQAIVADAGATIALTTSAIYDDLEKRFEHTPDLQVLHWLNTEHLSNGAEFDWHVPKLTGDSLAFLQYTSGSTSIPKGVMVTHKNLLHNLTQISQGFQLTTQETGMIWLPSYHDMGLIGGLLTVIYIGGRCVLMAPFAFLQRPSRWLQAISRYQATISGGPNFAYDLCVEKIKPEVRETLDLSSWRLAFSGAEPVRPDTIRRFRQAFEPYGFNQKIFYPCYGLAEATLFVSGGDGPAEPKFLSVKRSALENDQVEQVESDNESALSLVCCGSPKLEQQIVIADPDSSELTPAGQVGEIWVAGESIAQGYWNRPQETNHTFRAYLASNGQGPFMRTGDLGFMHQGELYITGRLKDLIIIRGGNYYPQDIELTVEQSHEAMQSGSGAVFSIEAFGDEQLVVVQEVSRQHRNANLDEAIRAIRRAISENHDLQVHAIVLIKPLSIHKTSSGKIQRHACKNAFLKGELEVVQEWRAR